MSKGNDRRRAVRAIQIPAADPQTGAVNEPQARAVKEAAWSDGEASGGVFQDPNHPARFHRRGRGGRPERTVRRITVYVADELAVGLDMFLARGARSLNRSDVVEAAVRDYLAAQQ